MMISGKYIWTVSLLGITLLTYELSERRRPDFLAAPLDSLPSSLDGWTATAEDVISPGVLARLAPTSYLARKYSRGKDSLDLFIAFYAEQRGGESMHSPKHCLPGSGWEIWKQDSADLQFDGATVRVNKYSIENSGTRMLVYYWYQSKQRIIANEYMAKVLLVRDRLVDGRTAGSIVRIIVPDNEQAAKNAAQFAGAVMPYVQKCIGTAR